MSTNEEQLLMFNGVNGATGEYGVPPMTGEQLKSFILGESTPDNLAELKAKSQGHIATFGVKAGVDPSKLEESGWAVVFPAKDFNPAIKEALTPLLALRKEQAGKYYKVYEGVEGGVRPNESKTKWLSRQGQGPGPADPERVPYYVMLVGTPDQIDYRFQYQLDVQYAVGRVDFGDDLDAYESYAKAVVAAEKGQISLGRDITFFGVANPDDKATQLAKRDLIAPLLSQLKSDVAGWNYNLFSETEATKAKLSEILTSAPSMLFTASHGMEFPLGDPRQLPHQGALLCQDWPGPKGWRGKGAIPEEFYFAGTDIAGDTNLLGMVAFLFACYGAGTPQLDEFSKQAFKDRAAIAEHPFIAKLPQTMLRQGALAVIGHVERAWGYSFTWPGAGAQTEVFKSSLQDFMEGKRVGNAFEYFNERYAEMASDLTIDLEEADLGGNVDPYELAGKWTSSNDARGYVILGDPAVKLPLAAAGEKGSARPAVDSIIVATTGDTTSAPLKSGSGGQSADAKFGTMVVENEAAENFGVFDSARDAGSSMRQSLEAAAKKLVTTLSETIEDLSSLEVVTYVSNDIGKIDRKNLSGTAQLRAMTKIALDGDMETVVPVREVDTGLDISSATEIDESLWQIHSEMVEIAQQNKIEFMRAVAEIAGTLLESLK